MSALKILLLVALLLSLSISTVTSFNSYFITESRRGREHFLDKNGRDYFLTNSALNIQNSCVTITILTSLMTIHHIFF